MAEATNNDVVKDTDADTRDDISSSKTDEEQEINNEIEKENVEMPEVLTKIAEMIFEDIFPSKTY